ncbi:MAG TPA: HNH endonuclease signature motif containing protein [Naasia sp.]|jgi:hypothetical protein
MSAPTAIPPTPEVLAAALLFAAEQARTPPAPEYLEVSEDVARRLVHARSEGLCERCGSAWATDWHHRQNRSQGGVWCPSNGLDLCRSCHADIGQFPTPAYVAGFLVRRFAIPANQPVRLHLHGWSLLNRDGSVHLLHDRSIL